MSDEQKPATNPLLIPASIGALAIAIVIAAFIMRPQQPQYVPAPAPAPTSDVNVRVRPRATIQPSLIDNILDETRKPTTIQP